MIADRLKNPPLKRDPLPFSLAWMRRFLSHYLTDAPSRMHEELADDLDTMRLHRGQRKNRIAPRGSSKTTQSSKGFPLHGICEGYESYILLTSDSGEQAESFLDAIKTELEGNDELARAYPHACGVGPVWQARRIVTRNGVTVVAKGSQGRIRGLTKGHHRPTLVVIDDANEDADAFSPTKRHRRLNWLLKGVLPIGEPNTNFLSVGTAIHREAIVCELAKQGAWETKSYRSIQAWPHRMDLWHEWEKVYTNLADPKRADTARTFYDANRTAMDDGAEVLWQARFPLYKLMEIRATIGESAFACEMQDQPGTAGATEWGPELFDGPEFWVQQLPPKDRRALTVQFLDPSKGRADKPGDYQAHTVAVLGHDGLWYVDADLRRDNATEMMARAAHLCDYWRPDGFCVEDNGTMGLIQGEVNEQVAAGRFAGVACQTITSTEPKEFRIRSLSPYICRRQLRVVNSQGGRLLVSQLRDWPNGDHDDGPDSLAGAVRRIELAFGWRT